MVRSRVLLLFALVASLTACVKDQKEVAQEVGLLPSGCGSEGARMQASVDGDSYCADMQLIASGSDGSVMVTGLDIAGNTLVLQIDEAIVGQHAVTEMDNGVLYMQMGIAYVVAPGTEGTLIITAHDTEAHRLQASFDVALFNEMNGSTRMVSGDLDVVYTEQE